MKNCFTIFLICLFTNNSSGQIRNFYSEKNPEKNNPYVVLKNDTIFSKTANYKKVFFDNEQDGNDYLKAVFHYKNAKYLKQWKSEVRVYLSKKIDKKLRKEMVHFINTFPRFKNFKVSIVNNLEKANYFVKGTKDFKSIFEGKNYSEKIIQKSLYNNLNYRLKSDGNGYKSCVLSFHPDKIYDEESFLKKFKIVFFITMGNFQQNYWLKTNSLLNRKVDSINNLTKFDQRLLRYHYLQLYNESIDVQTFIKEYADYKK